MKKIFCILLTLFGIIAAVAQEKVISKSEFTTANINSMLNFSKSSYRITQIDNLETSSRKTVSEIYKNGGSRNVYESVYGNSTRTQEEIQLNGFSYKRINNGEWSSGKVRVAEPPKRVLNYQKEKEKNIIVEKKNEEEGKISVEKSEVYKYLGTELKEGYETDVYLIVRTENITDTRKPDRTEHRQNIQTMKFWFGKNDPFRKMEEENKSANETVIKG